MNDFLFFLPLKIWVDYNLVWDPSIYGGIYQINIPAQKIWVPGKRIYN